MTEEQFFTSYVNDFSEQTMENIDCLRISLANCLSNEFFWETIGGKNYIPCQALTDARAFAEEFLRITDGWTVSDDDRQNGFARFEGMVTQFPVHMSQLPMTSTNRL